MIRVIPFIFIILLCQGVFSLAEAALRSARVIFFKTKAENGDKRYERALPLVERPDMFLLALQIENILLSVLAGVCGGFFILPSLLIEEMTVLGKMLGFALTSVAVTSISVFLSGIVFRQIGSLIPEQTVVSLLPFIKSAAFFCKPIFIINDFFSVFIKNLFRAEKNEQKARGITEAELRIALREGEKIGIVESRERSMVEGVFYLGDRPAGAFMTHRSEIAWLDVNANLETVKKIIEEKRAQRYFPVADTKLDAVNGVVSVEDILLMLASGIVSEKIELKNIIKPPHFVPESMSALKVFEIFRKKKVDFLFVIDEYGGFAGILSLNDLVEEIVGQLSAGDQDADSLIRQSDGSLIADGGVNIDEIAELLSLPELVDEHQEYHTLGGFILSLAGEIPHAGASFDYHGFNFSIIDMDGNRIGKTMIVQKKEQ